MPSLTAWSERDFDIDKLEKYCESTRTAVQILLDLCITNSNASANLAEVIEKSTNEHDDETLLNNFLEDRVTDRVVQALLEFGRAGAPVETAQVKTLRRSLLEHEQKLPKALSELRTASERLTAVSLELSDVRKAKAESDQALLSAVMSKSELEKRFTPSALGGNTALPASAVNIMKKCDERIKAAQASQLSYGEKATDLREMLDEIKSESSVNRKENLQIIENIEKRKLNAISATSTEIISLNLILSSALQKETEGIIVETESVLNQSLHSSVESLQGLDWVQKILAMDNERNLYQLQHIAEAVAAHESEEEIKISDLEMEVQKIKIQIAQLQDGKGAFADRLAADYMNPSVRTTKVVDSLRVIPQFSLPLPLKTDCYAPQFWRGFAVEERHEDLKRITENYTLSDSEWDLVCYEQILLGYFEVSTKFPHLMSPNAWNRLKTVVHTCRMRLKIPTSVHEEIVSHLLPDTVIAQDGISPLDFRFRLCRIMVSASSAGWVNRQIAFLDFAIRCLLKEDQAAASAGSNGFVLTNILPLSALLASSAAALEPLDLDVCQELLEHLTTYCEEYIEGAPSVLPTPRGVLHEIFSRIWKFVAISIDFEENETNLIAAFLHNFLTNRQYPYHSVWFGYSLWNNVIANEPSVPAELATVVASVLDPNEQWFDSFCAEFFWFGRNSASPVSKTSSQKSFEKNDCLNETTSRVIGFDLSYLAILTVSARDSLVAALCDYRSKLEPEALEICVLLFQHSLKRSNTLVPLYMLPPESEFEDFEKSMCEYFISESARAVCNRLIEPAKYLDAIAVARAHASDESRGAWIADVTGAIWKVCFELICEQDIYSLAWKKKFSLGNTHRLIWTKGLQSRIRSVVELINRDDDLWMTDRLPPGGQEFLSALQVWERVSGDGGLTDIVRPKISRSLLVHLDRVESDSVPPCLHANQAAVGQCWVATRPPLILHSTNCVDLWTTIFTSIQAGIDSSSAQLSMATCAQMVVRCLEKYCDNAREGFIADLSFSHPLYVKAKRCFNRLIKSVDDETELPELFKNKKKRKNRIFKNTGDHHKSGDESDGDKNKLNTSLTSSGDLNLIGDNQLLLSDYFVITSRFGSHDPTALMVRLHDLQFSLGELDKVRETLTESIDKEHVRLSRLFKAQQKYVENSSVEEIVLQKLPKESVTAMLESIDAGVVETVATVTTTASIVASYLSLNLVFIDLKDDLFERLYMPTTRECSLAKILHRFESDKLTAFVLMAPLKWRTQICRDLIASFVYAWVYVVSDMASRGRMFKEFDSSVMNTDLTALIELAEQIGLKSDPETQELLRAVGSLPVYVSGSTPAEFKANCERALTDPTEKLKAKRISHRNSILPSNQPPTYASSYGRKPSIFK